MCAERHPTNRGGARIRAVIQPAARIIVVDDDTSVRKSLERLLRASGLAAESFPWAKESLERAPESATSRRPTEATHHESRTGVQHLRKQQGERMHAVIGKGRAAGLALALVALAVLAMPTPARASAAEPASDWKFDAVLYGWATGLDGEVGAGTVTGAVDVGSGRRAAGERRRSCRGRACSRLRACRRGPARRA